MSDDPAPVPRATHPGRENPHTAHVVDGNAVVGALTDLLAGDLSMLMVECGGCHVTAPLAEWRVEADRDGVAAFRVQHPPVLFAVGRQRVQCRVQLPQRALLEIDDPSILARPQAWRSQT